jgi:hypothetical protein
MLIQPSPRNQLSLNSKKVQRFSFYVMSVHDAIDLTAEEPRGSRGNPIDLNADNVENQATEANQIMQQELEILQKEVFEEETSKHRMMTKITTKRLEELFKQAQNGIFIEAEDDEEFYVDEDTGEWQTLKPIYAANVGKMSQTSHGQLIKRRATPEEA